MNSRLLSLAGILVFGVSLNAATSFTLTVTGAGSLQDGSYLVSPFTGTIGSSAVTLYCDDFNDGASLNTPYTSYVTQVGTTGSNLTNYTRYGVNDAPGDTTSTRIVGTGVNGYAALNYPAGTQLYEEMAWLATQSMNDGSGTNANNQDIAIQEAIWALTNDRALGVSPTNSSGYTGTQSSGATGTPQSYLQWIENANTWYNNGAMNGLTTGYTALVNSNWYIVTNVASAGCTIGSNGSTGCTPGTAGTGTTTQEFLAYYNGSLPTSTGGSGAAPEPASWLLIGAGLAGVAIFRRKQALAGIGK